MNKHTVEHITDRYVLGTIDDYVRWSIPDAVFKRYGISEYGEVIR